MIKGDKNKNDTNYALNQGFAKSTNHVFRKIVIFRKILKSNIINIHIIDINIYDAFNLQQ